MTTIKFVEFTNLSGVTYLLNAASIKWLNDRVMEVEGMGMVHIDKDSYDYIRGQLLNG